MEVSKKECSRTKALARQARGLLAILLDCHQSIHPAPLHMSRVTEVLRYPRTICAETATRNTSPLSPTIHRLIISRHQGLHLSSPTLGIPRITLPTATAPQQPPRHEGPAAAFAALASCRAFEWNHHFRKQLSPCWICIICTAVR